MILIIILFSSCSENDVKTDSILKRSTEINLGKETDCEEIIVIPEKTLNGDFDGDNRIEFLEYRIDDHKVKFTKIKLESTNDNLPIFEIPLDENYCGLHHLNNEGNLDKHPGDEISLVIAKNDFSNLNNLKIYGLRNQEWKELIDIPIWEWQIYEENEVELIEIIRPNDIKVKMRSETAELVDTILQIK